MNTVTLLDQPIIDLLGCPSCGSPTPGQLGKCCNGKCRIQLHRRKMAVTNSPSKVERVIKLQRCDGPSLPVTPIVNDFDLLSVAPAKPVHVRRRSKVKKERMASEAILKRHTVVESRSGLRRIERGKEQEAIVIK